MNWYMKGWIILLFPNPFSPLFSQVTKQKPTRNNLFSKPHQKKLRNFYFYLLTVNLPFMFIHAAISKFSNTNSLILNEYSDENSYNKKNIWNKKKEVKENRPNIIWIQKRVFTEIPNQHQKNRDERINEGFEIRRCASP